MIRRVPISRLDELLEGVRGLTGREVEDRRAAYGPNAIAEVVGNPWWDLVRDTAMDPMIWFLGGTSFLYGILGDRIEAITLLIALVPLAGMDAYLHRRTRASTEGLASRLAARATVLRDGVEIDVPAVEVVPGDLAIVSAGETFPADGIVLDGAGLQADESALTGEAYPARKRPLVGLHPQTGGPGVESERWGFAGTRLLTGRALVRIVFTGPETIYGEIVRSAASGAQAWTPLQAAVARLVSILIAGASVMCLVLAWVRLRQGYGWVDALLSAVTLAVAALPEEFPVVFTFFLGVGVYRLAKRQALVRRAVSVENIGRVSCICSDKTGTMTQGRLCLTHLVPSTSGTDRELLAIAALASRREGGDPLDAAILDRAEAEGTLQASSEVLTTFPFTEDRRRETALVRDHSRTIAATKGAPEVIFAMSTLEDVDRRLWAERVSTLAEEGHKVIACAWQSWDDASKQHEPDQDFQFAGLLACEDPVREGVVEAARLCREAGIHTIMVTGDHPTTARAVAGEIGLGSGSPVVISGDDLERRLASAPANLRGLDVIARALPRQKLALVRALQASGEIVVATGDGVNDVPALQAADIGVAMGGRGTPSAREAAAIVLLDDNFRSIVHAIAEGRQLFKNLQRSFAYLLMVHIPLVTTAALIPLAGYPLLYLPIHIVWLEMLIHPTALLVFQEAAEAGVLQPVQRQRTAAFFSRREWIGIFTVGVLITLMITLAYARSLGTGRNIEHARTMALATLTFTGAMLTAALSRLGTPASRLIVAVSIVLMVALAQTPVVSARMHLEPLHLDDWGIATLDGLLIGSLPILFKLFKY